MHAKTIIRLIRTTKHLQIKQIYYQIYYRLVKLKVKPLPSLTYAQRDWLKPWCAPRLFLSTLTENHEITFLAVKGYVSDWNNSNYSKLWLYNLHYFNELNTLDCEAKFETFYRFIEQWIQENPPFIGVGWEPYPTSIRIVNFIKWFSKYSDNIKCGWLDSLILQTEALFKRLEYHILANHLFSNGKSLIFSGVYFTGNRPDQWLRKGLQIIDQEIKEQFLEDGGHFELSPMYHASLLWDLCDLIHLADCSGLIELSRRRKDWERLLIKGLRWLQHMSHPDGEISFFNDAAFHIAPNFKDIASYCKFLNICLSDDRNKNKCTINHLKNSGYCSINLDKQHKVILDVGKIGADYQPGHAHADSLSFELSLYGQRVIVNSGTSDYTEGMLRQYQRSTKAHNTVRINRKDSSEMWASFRVARRAKPCRLSILENDKTLTIDCSHDGYQRLPGNNMHIRKWDFLENQLLISDEIHGEYEHAEARFYFHPTVNLIKKENRSIQGKLPEGKFFLIILNGKIEFDIESTTWYPSFGTALANQCLVVKFQGNGIQTKIIWEKY